jgi:hypothetical protein
MRVPNFALLEASGSAVAATVTGQRYNFSSFKNVEKQ